MRKAVALIFSLFILLLCAAPLLLASLGVDTPNLEKRTLALQPQLLTRQGALNTQFMAELDRYIADHFPLRTALISAWHRLNIVLFAQSGNSRVILGREGWLFFAETAPSYVGQDSLSAAECARLDIILRLQAEYLARRGIRFLYTVAPNKNTVYPGQMPARYPDRTAMNALAGLADSLTTPGYVDLRSLLREQAAAGSQTLYHRTDSHWNNLGARLVVGAILQAASGALGESLPDFSANAGFVERTDWQGDLAVMLYPSGPTPDVQQYFTADPKFRFTRPVKSLEDLQITTTGPGSRSLLMFRDSFANALIPLLSESFSQAVYSRAVPYDYSFLEKSAADLVLLEIAERNLSDWLETPPKMAAWPLQTAKPSAADVADALSSPAFSVAAELTQGSLVLRGRLASENLPPDWTQVLVAIGPQLYEAFPVTDFATDHSADFVLYLQPGQWSAGPVSLNMYLKIPLGWLCAEAIAELP
jgi:hypothetical protein